MGTHVEREEGEFPLAKFVADTARGGAAPNRSAARTSTHRLLNLRYGLEFLVCHRLRQRA
jgi:hypothetical protein